jgi:organic hydroperoxide reductase OsmC/OhrA
MERKTFKYFANVDWEKGKQGFLTGGFKDISVACPPEFGGPGGIISPEDLFVASLAVCLMATFLNRCARNSIELVSYTSKNEGFMEFVGDAYQITKAWLRPTIKLADNSKLELAKSLLHEAERVCPVGRSVKTEVILEEAFI